MLRFQPPAVPLSLALWLAALSVLEVLDFFMVSHLWGMTIAFLPNAVNYFLAYVAEALFVDDVRSIVVRFRALNRRLEALCWAAVRAEQQRAGTAHAGGGASKDAVQAVQAARAGKSAREVGHPPRCRERPARQGRAGDARLLTGASRDWQ